MLACRMLIKIIAWISKKKSAIKLEMQPDFLLQSEVSHMQDWLYGLIIVY